MADVPETATPTVEAVQETQTPIPAQPPIPAQELKPQESETDLIQKAIDMEFQPKPTPANPQAETDKKMVEVPMDIAQKGVDYTQKTQELALEKADVTAQKHSIELLMEGINALFAGEQPLPEKQVELTKTDTVSVQQKPETSVQPKPDTKPLTDEEKFDKRISDLLESKLKPIIEGVERDKQERLKRDQEIKMQQQKAELDNVNKEINNLAVEYPYFDKEVTKLEAMSKDKTLTDDQRQQLLDSNLAFQAMNVQASLGYSINPKTMKPYTLKESYEFVAFQNGVGREKPNPKEIAKNATLTVPVSTAGNVPEAAPMNFDDVAKLIQEMLGNT